MICIKLMGGLGNQMFQYSIGLSLARIMGTHFVLDDSILKSNMLINKNSVKRTFDLDIFTLDNSVYRGVITIETNKIKRNLNKILPLNLRSYITEASYDFDPNLFFLRNNNITLEGYWQSYKYFSNFTNEIRGSFTLRNSFVNLNDTLFEEIANSESVCINVRRADFETNSYHGTLNIDYYKEAVELLSIRKSVNFNFFIFSDDIQWCMKNFDFLPLKTFVDHSHKGDMFSNYFALMSSCKYFIIPNSSFAWWAAWLSTSPSKLVICPKTWFLGDPMNKTKDLIPGEWIRI
jgi:hypothetical protein